MTAAPLPVDEQMAILTAGCVDVISESDLAERLEEAIGSQRGLRVKLGVDPTASDLHLGSAVVLSKLRQFQDLGHVAVLIIGDFTAMVGDPTGRSATRPRLSRDEVDRHAATYIDQLGQILDLDPARFEVRRNSEWLQAMGMEEVLRLTGSTTVARMLERNDFATRYAQGDAISLTELLYPLLQGWDSVEVEADVELGGTDQLFNNLVGRRLQHQEGRRPQVVVTMPLLEGLDGVQKMSKSLGNAIGVTEAGNEMFAKTMSIPDTLVPSWLRLTTGWTPDEVGRAVTAFEAGDGRARNAAKRALARRIVDRYHAPGAGEAAESEFDRVFKRHAAPSDLAVVRLVADEFPMTVWQLVVRSGLAPSNSQARRLVQQGAVKLDGVAYGDAEAAVTRADADGRRLQAGKRKWAAIEVVTGS